jgi:hypothetical protein
MIVVFLFPIAFRHPAVLFSVPPSVIFVPATLAFGIKIAPAFVGLTAVFAPVVDRSVQSGLGFLDGVLALRVLVCARLRRRRYEQQKRSCHYC